MNKYADEEFIKAKNAYKKKSSGDIRQGVFVKEELLEFEKVSLFDGMLTIYLPTSFFDMPENQAQLKYPMAQRPQIIKTNDGTDVNLTFNMIPQKVGKNMLKQFTEQMKQVLKRVQPASVFYPICYMDRAGNVSSAPSDEMSGDEEISEKEERLELSFFDYKSPAIDETLYHFMFFAPVKDAVFQGTFNCRFQDAEIWKGIFMQVTDSIRIV